MSKRRYLRVESNPRPRQEALLGGAGMEEAEPVVAELSEGKKKKGSKGLPPGILEHRSGKLEASSSPPSCQGRWQGLPASHSGTVRGRCEGGGGSGCCNAAL